MIRGIELSSDDSGDILDNERLVRVLNELIIKLNELDDRVSALERP
jgi:hypothetical protein